MDHSEILKVQNKRKRKSLLKEYWKNNIKQSDNTGKNSILTKSEFKELVNININ